MATAGLEPGATGTEPQEQQEGTSPVEKPWHTPGQAHPGSTGSSPWHSAKAAEPADASDVIRGLIRELSDLNRLAMGARRGLELLRRPKPRRGRRAVPGGSRWKEG
ncbi:break repair meiotic recombinase recruitment factor 1 isoform X2 [Motacilla alba alba]|uniref:break repair meiotic recombinase recruitment factor 1 isoform X2 n=1 Tax=Motacilla alba alba TaxID=1094192 RepID=UPI0018D518CB|nr:break repair meiotic recombinase recruitment factor 1 isoform X2 [Motacilla alba alba]